MKVFVLFLSITSAKCPVGESEFLKYECDFTVGAGDVAGALQIFQCSENDISQVHFLGKLSSSALFDGEHGFHIHASNDVSTCTATGGHFKSKDDEIHGFPEDELPERHAGDLGNITAKDGLVSVEIRDTVVSLDPKSPQFIGEKAIVIHADRDDGNPERDPSSTGDAGARIGCCALKVNSSAKNSYVSYIFILLFMFLQLWKV